MNAEQFVEMVRQLSEKQELEIILLVRDNRAKEGNIGMITLSNLDVEVEIKALETYLRKLKQ